MAAREMVVARPRRRNQVWHVLERTLFFTVVAAVVFATLFPLYWMFITSARGLEENGEFPPGLFPHTWNWLPYIAVFSDFPLAQWLFHSLEVGLLVTVIVLFFATLGAYALSCL